MDDTEIKYFVEAALLAAGGPLSIDQLQKLFDEGAEPEKSQIRQAISTLLEEYEDRGFTIREVASGFRIQIESDMVKRLQKLWEQRPPRYSRAMFETLALIAYRQPMTRGEIEEIRGVAVSTNIIRSLLEREWVRIVGHRDVPGRPEMFGTTKPPQNEDSAFNPVSPYGCAKLNAYHMVNAYRKGYKMFACNGILFNHESERRGLTFVTRKITRAAARIKLGLQDKLYLGNVNALRDWGHSKDYVRAMWMILQADEPDNWVVSTGEAHSVLDFIKETFNLLELDWGKYVVIKEELKRPNEVPALLGNSTKIRIKLGWKPEISFKDLVRGMVMEDLQIERNNLK